MIRTIAILKNLEQSYEIIQREAVATTSHDRIFQFPPQHTILGQKAELIQYCEENHIALYERIARIVGGDEAYTLEFPEYTLDVYIANGINAIWISFTPQLRSQEVAVKLTNLIKDRTVTEWSC